MEPGRQSPIPVIQRTLPLELISPIPETEKIDKKAVEFGGLYGGNNMRLCVLILSLFGSIFIFNGCQSRAARSTSGGVIVRTPNSAVSVVFNDHDRQVIGDYYARYKAKKVPPGLAKKDQLPPGLAKQVMKNGTLPPGLQSRALPPDLEIKLSRLPDGYKRVIIGANIAILNTTTRVIADIITDVAIP
jgi:hypothetical protein